MSNGLSKTIMSVVRLGTARSFHCGVISHSEKYLPNYGNRTNYGPVFPTLSQRSKVAQAPLPNAEKARTPSHTMGPIHPGNIPPRSQSFPSEVSQDEGFVDLDDEVDPDDAFEGPNAYKFVMPNYETENFSFDPEIGILQEPEDERRHYEQVVKPKREESDRLKSLNVGGVVRDINLHLPRDFEASTDEKEWAYVERLLPMKTVPPLPAAPNKDGSYPSGFVAPRTRPGDFSYHVSRTRSHMLPVYTTFSRSVMLVTTYIGKCEGNLFDLRDDLKKFLFERYEQEFMSQVAELYGKVKFRGDFEQDFKEFLIEKGF